MKSVATVEELALELEAAYGVIEYAVPLALRLLKTGGASLEEQRAFWSHIEELEQQFEILDDVDSDHPLIGYSRSILERREELSLLGERDDAPAAG